MHTIDRNASKLNRLGRAKRHSLTDFQMAEVDTKVELIRALVPLGLLAAALLDIEPRLRRIRGYRHLPKLRLALKRELCKPTHEQSRAA